MMDRLISNLIEGMHPIELEAQTKTLSELSERVKGGFVFINFIDTQGGTEIGIKLDERSKKSSQHILNDDINTLKIVGTCKLNYHNVACRAEVNLKTRKGFGCLELIDDS